MEDISKRFLTSIRQSRPMKSRPRTLKLVKDHRLPTKPSQANEAAFNAAIDDVAAICTRLLRSLETSAPPKNREEEAAKAKARAAERFGT